MLIFKKNPVITQVQELLESFDFDRYSSFHQDRNSITMIHDYKPYSLQTILPAGLQPVEGSIFANTPMSSNLVLFNEKQVIADLPLAANTSYNLLWAVPFGVEKDFRRQRGQGRVFGWEWAAPERQEADTISPVLQALNEHPQYFTSGWCHSGAPSECPVQGSGAQEGYVITKLNFTRDEARKLVASIRQLQNVDMELADKLVDESQNSYPRIMDPASRYKNYVIRVQPAENNDEAYRTVWSQVAQTVRASIDDALCEEYYAGK